MSRCLLLLAFLFPLFLAGQPPASSLEGLPGSVRTNLEKGRMQEKAGHFLQAELSYRQALSEEETNKAVFQHLAFLFLRTQQWDDAVFYLNRMEGAPIPQKSVAFSTKLVSNQFDLPLFEKPREKDPDFPNKGDAENLALVAANPRHASAHFDLGLRCWGLEGRDSLAEYHLRMAIAAQPQYPEARQTLGQLLQLQERFGEAEVHFLHNARRVPDNEKHWDDLALLYFQWNRPARLEETWREQLRQFPRDQRTLRNLGLLLELQGRYVEVERIYLEYQFAEKDILNGFRLLEDHYLRCADRYPDSIRFHEGLAELYYQHLFIQPLDWGRLGEKDPDAYRQYLAQESVRHFLTLERLRPGHPALGQISYQLGHLYLFLGDPQNAIPWLQQAASLQQEKTDPLFELVDAYLAFHRPLDALDSLESLAAGPGLDYEHDVLFARLLALEGRLDEAITLSDSIIAYYPNSRTPQTYRIKAFVLEQQDNTSGAYEALKESISVEYSSATDYYQIARLYFSGGPKENGLIWLDGALAKGLPRIIVQNDPALDPVRNWEPFKEILGNY